MSKLSAQSPMDDLTYDVLTVLQKKAKALEAYATYVSDARSEEGEELEDLFTQMRRREEEDIGVLKEILARRLDEELGYEADESVEDEEDDDDDDEEEVVPPEDIGAGATAPDGAARPGESGQRHR